MEDKEQKLNLTEREEYLVSMYNYFGITPMVNKKGHLTFMYRYPNFNLYLSVMALITSLLALLVQLQKL